MERFWQKVAVGAPDECWLWTGATSSGGYGRFKLATRMSVQAHRMAYELEVGEIPAGLDLDHLCRNRACCNPAHLEPVTRQVNVLRGVGMGARHARRTHCSAGHEFTPENTHVRLDGARRCRSCDQARSKRRWEAQKAKR